MSIKSNLPAAEIAEQLNRAIAEEGVVIVTAPPGAGKSTLLPLTIREGLLSGLSGRKGSESADAGPGKILMLEPRRIAARQVAERMAGLLGEKAGQRVGYRMRGGSKVSASTEIEVVTEGILTRMMIEDPTLDGVAVIIFDEFHERSIYCDEALCLARETRSLIRPDLSLVIMSATMDTESLGATLDAPVIESKGRLFPIETFYSGEDADAFNCALLTARTVMRALREQEGDILAFLPGEADIRKCVDMLEKAVAEAEIDVLVRPLYGMLPFEAQGEAIRACARRKVVVATPVAETSLTIEGVRVVVDSGLCRTPVFDARSGLSRLETVRISKDMADQRRGRAGRLAPGVCYRLWTTATQDKMDPCRKPEILKSDLSALVLDIAAWGESSPSSLKWVSEPPREHLAEASRLLRLLGAVDEKGCITAHGRRLSALSCHPRLAQMRLKASGAEEKSLAENIATLLEERGTAPGSGTDISLHIRNADPYTAGKLIASAWPERIAKAREEGCGHFRTAGGENIRMDTQDELSTVEWIAVASLNASLSGEGRIFLAAPLLEADLEPYVRERSQVVWDRAAGAVKARRERSVGCLLLESKDCGDASREDIVKAVCEAAPKEGRTMFDFNDEVENFQRRVAAAAAWHPEAGFPDFSTQTLLACAAEWLPLHIGKASTVAQLRKIDLCAVMNSLLDYPLQLSLERIAPSHITVPTGSRIRVEYRQGAELPVVRVRIQECFGMASTPLVDNGRRKVLLELLSPGFKPVQLTSDLGSFWETAYFEVRNELRRRYPRHSWPDDPLSAPPARGVRRG